MGEGSAGAVLEKSRPPIRDVAVMDAGFIAGKEIVPVLDIIMKTPPEKRPKAFVMLGEVTGVVPDPINPWIKQFDENGIPVFIVSKRDAKRDHRGEYRGVTELKYGPHIRNTKAGAILLKDANVLDIVEVAEEIQIAIDEGKTGEDLKAYVISKYGRAEPEGTHPFPNYKLEEIKRIAMERAAKKSSSEDSGEDAKK
jgi:hypothetical protein